MEARTDTHIIELDQLILDHIKTEFGSNGERTVGFFKTARSLLANTDTEQSRLGARLGEVVAYCLREGIVSILRSQDKQDSNRPWKKLTRDLVNAKKRYTQIQDILVQDKQAALDELLEDIDLLEEFHISGRRVYEERLIAILLGRTGVEPYEQDIKLYQTMLNELNEGLHKSITIEDIIQLWNKCMRLITRLFSSPDIRQTKLKELSAKNNPTERDFELLIDLIATPQHARIFFEEKINVKWLNLFVAKRELDPPSNPNGMWPGFTVVNSLGEVYPIEIANWLIGLERRFGDDLIRTQFIARAALMALKLGSPTDPVLYESIKKHPTDPSIVNFNIRGIEYIDPKDSRVEEIADFALNKGVWSGSGALKPLLEALIKGICVNNVKARLRLICYKLKSIDTNDYWRRSHEGNHSGSIADWKCNRTEDRFTELVVYLLKAILEAQELIDTNSLLSVTDTLSGIVRSRTRSWILSKARDVDSNILIEEISKSISKRYPTGDDLPLLDRVVNEICPESYIERWKNSLGPAPSISEVGRTLASNQIPKSWWYVLRWLEILPDKTFGTWTNPALILWSELGRLGGRNYLAEQHPVVEIKSIKSPISAEQLNKATPLEAARMIALWRPDPSDWTASAHRLATTLQAVIKDNPSGWISNPIALVSELHHPTYIDHYLRSILEIIREQNLPKDTIPISELVDVILLVYSTPWQPTSLGTSIHTDLDQNWRGAKRATGELVRELANNNAGFCNNNDEVWQVIKKEVQDISEPFEYTNNKDMMFIAINRNCTQALQTVFALIAYDYRNTEYVRPNALELLENCLRVDYPDGAYYRAIISPQINFLLLIAPVWVNDNRDLLFGMRAPGELGQLTIDLALEWGQPSQWLLENYSRGIKDAVKREVERSLHHMLIAMLWELPGYSIHKTANYLLSLERFPKETGFTISKLVSGMDVEDNYRKRAIQFWSILIDTVGVAKASNVLGGFSWMVSVEFRDPIVWAEMTLRTLTKTDGRIEVPWQVAEYAVQIIPSKTTLEIMNLLLRVSTDEIGLQYMILNQAKLLIEKSNNLKDTDAYLRLQTAIIERGGFQDSPS